MSELGKKEKIELLIKLIEVGQEGTVRPDKGGGGVVRDAVYCKDSLKAIWNLLGDEDYLGFNDNIVTTIK